MAPIPPPPPSAAAAAAAAATTQGNKMEVEAQEEDPYSRPRPRPQRSPSALTRLQIQNRRREYLSRNPSYFHLPDHELSDPLLHDHLIRRFLTPAEREADSRGKGYARVLEGSLLRGEERLARLSSRQQQQQQQGEEQNGSPGGEGGKAEEAAAAAAGTSFASFTAELLPPPETKEEGAERWRQFLEDRFIRGEDEDFDYAEVDSRDEFDELERREKEEEWIEGEEPRWAVESDDDDDEMGGDKVKRVLKGETGIQDF
ncbi:coiled-coil domain-containing protein-domain-containing protein [Triangularia verruculosa]|uniref:Coiled-coil domain-containing protein-domain-containing protein n=1 Tax=Triangularia verruculosa TaxID=2587418 RepID=A0AAN7AT36_9PEZI|nr:coiled-coil domain-containing protein-domain-containing protein [Triangularia verruculosa]